jgi:hypothetical protein
MIDPETPMQRADGTFEDVNQIDDDATVIESIRTGQYDASIRPLAEVVADRLRYLKGREIMSKSNTWKPGDKVKVIGGRPHYLIGSTATIKKVMNTYVLIKLHQDIGKFKMHHDIRCPMSILEKIS